MARNMIVSPWSRLDIELLFSFWDRTMGFMQSLYLVVRSSKLENLLLVSVLINITSILPTFFKVIPIS